MAAAVEYSDIDKFIQNQKVKLQQERDHISQQQSRANLGDNTPRKPLVDHRRWNQSFQQEKKKDYNEFVQKPKPKKAATPPHAGMRFGEYEDFKKQTDGYRKEAYRQQLEKQQYDQARQHAVKIRLVEDGDQPPEEAEVRLAEEQDTRRKVQKHRKDIRDKFVEDKKFREFEKMLALNRQNGVKLPELEDEYGTDQEEDQVPGEQDWREEFLSPRRAPVEDLDVQQFHIDMKQEEDKQKVQSRLPPKPSTPGGMFSKLGKHEDERTKLNEERKLEYNQLLAERSPQPRGSDTGQRDTPPERDIREREKGRDVVDRNRERDYPDRGRDRDYVDRGRDRDYPERGRNRDYPDRGRDRDYPDRDRDYPERGRDYPERGRDYPERDRDRGRDRDYPDRDRDYQGRGRDGDYPERGGDRDYPDRDRDRDYQDRGRDYQDRGYQDADRNQGQDNHDTRNGKNVGIQALRNRDSADLKKQKTRNEEYNEFLRQKQEKEKHRFDDKKPKQQRQDRRNGRPSSEPDGQRKKKEEIFATLPGINYSGSAQRGRQSDRPPAGPRKGWQTPNYEEILDKKRKEEASYRRDDPQIERGMRAYASEGALDNLEADERRYKKLDQIYDDRKVKFRDQRANQSILDDDEWLNKGRDRAKEEEYRELMSRLQNGSQKDNTRSEPPRVTPRGGQGQDPAMAAKYYATLPVGQDERESAKRRRKEKYRDELQLQMRERQAAERREKEREKIEDLKVNASGLLDPEKTSHRLQRLGDPDLTPRRNIRSPEVKAYHTKFDLSPRGGRGLGLDDGGYGGGGYTARERGRPRERRYNAGYGAGGGGGGGYDGGILDEGFKLLEPRRQIGSLGPPARLQYQPSFADPSIEPTRSYVTADQGGLGPAYSSIDDAYHAYALKNPLDPEPAGVPPLGLDKLDGGGGGYYGRSSPRVTFDDRGRDTGQESSRLRDRSKERISPYQFPSDDDVRSRSRTDQRSYQNELDRQIQEKKMQKLREKEEQQRYERKLEDDIKNYNPFGRGGGGAPNRDQQGNVIADLRKMRGGQYSARSPPPPRESPRLRPPGSPKDDLFRPPPTQTDASGDPTHARGGHGIFGMPRTDAEKDTAERYKDDLRRQIEEKRRLDQQEREREKMEEEKENRRLEEQRKRIQQEYEEELRKKRDKEEEVRRKNEEMRLEAEERKREAERKKRENAENRRQLKEDKENSPRQPEPRGSSPPVPALKSHLATEDGEPSTSEEVRRNSPPIPALRKAEPENQAPEPVARANSSDVLKELANMRQQLQSERRRVENALETQRNEPTVFDPRTLQRPAPKEIDVFERAKIGAPTVPVRTADNANAKNLHDFYNLKHGYNSDSRKGLRSMFPEAPVTNSALDSQQNALLRQQEDSLNAMKQRGPAASRLATPTRQGTVSPRSLLQSNSAFIDIDGVNNFPDDFEDLPRRNESARYRRRERVTVSPRVDVIIDQPESQPVNPLGSTTSLDVDHIQRKNDARLRRLHQMNTDEVSLADPDDILDRFMAKQKYNRPPSGQTLQDDTWLRPTSKAI